MSDIYDTKTIEAALQRCADEPVHIPGLVQSFGCLLASTPDGGEVQYVSENLRDFADCDARAALGRSLRDVLGRDAWHGVRNSMSQSKVGVAPVDAGAVQIGDRYLEMRVFKGDANLIVELEPEVKVDIGGADSLKTLTFLMGEIQKSPDEDTLFKLTVQLLQDVTGYDRCLIYRFDTNYNGEVTAEAARLGMEKFQGLHFPHWDVPAQAREMMRKIPFRLSQDTKCAPISLHALPNLPPLDITHQVVRGNSPIHMRYLQNMGVAASLTLNVMQDTQLWGMISFHHRRPRLPSPGMRSILVSFLRLFEGRLTALRQGETLQRIRSLDAGLTGQAAQDLPFSELIPSAGPEILRVMKAHGMCSLSAGGMTVYGDVPDQVVLDFLTETSMRSKKTIAIDSMVTRFPAFAGKFGKSAGCLMTGVLPDRAVCIFRNEEASEISWAGNPEKTIEVVEGEHRLHPRSSFSVFLDESKGRSAPWDEGDIFLAEHVRSLLQAAERQVVMDTLNRQQALMIGELNHRVRNILALVRSVSRQARRRYGSLDSYANAIENRVKALAAAHDISQGRAATNLSVKYLLSVEFEPFSVITDRQTKVVGDDAYLLPGISPIVSLVFHELTTNAAKYGALSNDDGEVTIALANKSDGLEINWLEKGGPRTKTPNERGFGMAMIEQAIPHELGGRTELFFENTGFRARFHIPKRHFGQPSPDTSSAEGLSPIVSEDLPTDLPKAIAKGSILLLEDNFVIAKETADDLKDSGAEDVIICSDEAAAFEVLETTTPSLAILDINLGAGRTSEAVARHLLNLEIPMLFITGYGEDEETVPDLKGVKRLIKPASITEIVAALQA